MCSPTVFCRKCGQEYDPELGHECPKKKKRETK
jgi:hypothetical protein